MDILISLAWMVASPVQQEDADWSQRRNIISAHQADLVRSSKHVVNVDAFGVKIYFQRIVCMMTKWTQQW